jgi:PAT family beta-lactamase induction signal transducer AmpG
MAAIALMALAGPDRAGASLTVFVALAVVVAFLSATHDIAADAFRTDSLAGSELGPGASVFMTGYRAAMLASGAGAVYLAADPSKSADAGLPWRDVYLLAAAAMGVGTLATLAAREPVTANLPRRLSEAVIEPMHEFMARTGWRAPLILLFIVLFKLPDYMAARMTDPLLLDLGFTNKQIAFWGLGVGIAVTIPGVLAGGVIVAKLGLRQALLIFGLAQAISNGGYMLLAYLGRPPLREWMIAAVSVEYFCTGLVVAGFVAFLMSQCNKRYSATQYALLSSVMGFSSALAGAPTGWLVQRAGYFNFFAITILVGLPGLLLIFSLPLPRPADRNPSGNGSPS